MSSHYPQTGTYAPAVTPRSCHILLCSLPSLISRLQPRCSPFPHFLPKSQSLCCSRSLYLLFHIHKVFALLLIWLVRSHLSINITSPEGAFSTSLSKVTPIILYFVLLFACFVTLKNCSYFLFVHLLYFSAAQVENKLHAGKDLALVLELHTVLL